MIMRRNLLIALGIVLMLSAVACSENSGNNTTDTANNTSLPDEATTADNTTTADTTSSADETTAPVYAETTVNVADHLNDIFRTLGRTYVKNGRLKMDFACGGIHFLADCEGDVKVQIYVSSNNPKNDNRFTIYVDGERQPTRLQVTRTNSGQYFTIASNLSRGVHVFRLINQTQFIWTSAEIGDVRIVGQFGSKPAERELFLEFYGDSILNGANIRMGGTSVDTSDATQTFAFLTAEALNADMSVVGCSSMGLVINKTRNFVMKDIYNYCGAQYTYTGSSENGHLVMDGIPEYDFSRIPDAVIIELGVNDAKASDPEYKAAVSAFVENIRMKYGNDVPIVWLVGYASGRYNTLTPQQLNAMGGESAKLYVRSLSNASVPTSQGGDGTHPNIESAKVMAEELTAYLKNLLNIDA